MSALPARIVEDYPGALRVWLLMRRAEIATAVSQVKDVRPQEPGRSAVADCIGVVADELLRLVEELVPDGRAESPAVGERDEDGPDPDRLEAAADEAADAREYEAGRESSVLGGDA